MRGQVSTVQRHKGVIAVVVVLVAALVIAQFTTFGRSVSVDFYAAVAQVIPVFLLALLVEAATPFGDFGAYTRRQAEFERTATTNAVDAQTSLRSAGARTQQFLDQGGKMDEEGMRLFRNLMESTEAVIDAADEAVDLGGELSAIGALIGRTLLSYVAAAAVGEAAALYALGAGTSTTFLLMTATLSLVAMVVLFVEAAIQRFTYRSPFGGGAGA